MRRTLKVTVTISALSLTRVQREQAQSNRNVDGWDREYDSHRAHLTGALVQGTNASQNATGILIEKKPSRNVS